jgi:nucleotide-binding universal stress UspA family protein
MNWKTIVVGVDDTDASKRALERVVDLVGTRQARLVLTSITPVLVGMAGAHGVGPFDPVDSLDDHKLALLHARDFLAEHDLDAELELEAGNPAHEIVSVAEKHEADLIVVGTQEPDFLERLLRGSVSQAVARQAHCDVLVVH